MSQPEETLLATICTVFSEVLEIDVAADDDFFALGGHSLAAWDAAERLQDSLPMPDGVELSPAVVFECGTPRALTSHLASKFGLA
jgi:hypothetical protein